MRFLEFLGLCASLCCFVLQSSCTHQKASSESDVNAASGLYSQMSIEELVAFQSQFLEGIWDHVLKERMVLPSGFDLDKVKDYVSQELLPIFVPLQKGGWKVSEVRPSVLSQLLNASTGDAQSNKTPFLKDRVSKNVKTFRKCAEMEDYKYFIEKYTAKTKELYAAYPNDVPVREMRVESSPVLSSSEGQRILIYGDGPFHMTTYLKYRDRIIGMYEVDQNGAMHVYDKSFKLDEISAHLADLYLDLTKNRFFDEGSLEYMMLEAKRKNLDHTRQYSKLDTELNPEHSPQNSGVLTNWSVLEFLVAFNPDAQFVLVFDNNSPMSEECSKSELGETPFREGSALGKEMVKLLRDFDVNFVNMFPYKTTFEKSLKDYWMFKSILKALPDLIVVVSANDPKQRESLVKDKIDQSLLGLHDLTQDGLIFASDMERYMNIKNYETEFFVNSLAVPAGFEIFSAIDLGQNLAYTTLPRWIAKDLIGAYVPFEWVLSQEANVGFRLFEGGFLQKDVTARELQRGEIFSPKGASLVILSYFNWLRQHGVVKSRKDVTAFFDRQAGVPVFIDIFKNKQYLSGLFNLLLHDCNE